MAMQHLMRNGLIGVSLLALAGCMGDPAYVSNSLSASGFGESTDNNMLVETGQRSFAINLSRRFASQVPNTVNFAFDSAVLDDGARAILMKQADWIRHFPEVRFRVYGYTDLVGSEAYNKGLGMRRARAVVAFLSRQGISTSRLEAVVSYGKTQPLIPVQTEERRNRRAITDVSGFVRNSPMILDGKYAEVVYRSYVASAANEKSSSGSSASGGSGGSTGSSTGGLDGSTLPPIK